MIKSSEFLALVYMIFLHDRFKGYPNYISEFKGSGTFRTLHFLFNC